MPARWLPAALVTLALSAAGAWLHLAGAEPAVVPASPTAVPSAVVATPRYQRIEVEAGAVRQATLRLQAPAGARVLAVTIDCPCLRVLTVLPVAVDAHGNADIALAVTGVLPGIKTIGIATTAGHAQAQIQVVTPGLAAGVAALDQAVERTRMASGELWLVAWNLSGELRNCGCSGGSLGGLDHLVALPVADRGVPVRLLLAGDAGGGRPGYAEAVERAGWRSDPVSVRAGTPADLAQPGIVICDDPQAPAHARLVRPLLDRGQTLIALIVRDGQVVERLDIPVDRSLPADPSVLAGFAAPPAVVDERSNPSATCIGCHADAAHAWSASRHARAFASLPAADRTDACIDCHTTPGTGQAAVRIAGVHCQSCHQGSDRHAADPTRLRTTGTTDCRSCHDAKHHPSFDPVAAWAGIRHGR